MFCFLHCCLFSCSFSVNNLLLFHYYGSLQVDNIYVYSLLFVAHYLSVFLAIMIFENKEKYMLLIGLQYCVILIFIFLIIYVVL